MAPLARDPVDVAQAQLDAYNAGDLEAFLECYAEDTQIEDGDGNLLMGDREAMRSFYEALFGQSPDLHCELRSRIDVGRFIVDEEFVTGAHMEGFPAEIHAAVVYRIEDGLIRHARLLM